jgi:Tol biopolymer transport system component
MKGRWSAVMALCIAASDWASLAATRPDEPRPPINLRVDALIQPVIDSMWQASPTFRRQCRRLATEPRLQVTVAREDEPTRSAFANARTVLTFEANVLVGAHVFLKTDANGPELIAHELEHILEQLDGVDLQGQAGNGAVWKSERASYETRRAIETGRRVGREVADGAKRKRDAASTTNSTMTVKLADQEANPVSARTARISPDGRSVVFTSSAALSADDRNSLRDVYVMDLATHFTSLVSLGPTGGSGNGDALQADISGNGRYVVFASEAGNLLTTSFPAGCAQIFLYDREDQTTRLLSATVEGRPANGRSGNPVISANGALVAFESAATDLVSDRGGRQNATVGIYLFRLATGERKRLDIAEGERSAGSSMSPAISADGRYVVFASRADLACGNQCQRSAEAPARNRLSDIYVYDTESNTTRRLSHGLADSGANGHNYDPAISGDGRFVAFVSEASNLTRDSNGRSPQIYLHDLALGTTALVSRSLSGRPGNGNSLRPALSFDGSILVFQSLATNLVCERKCSAALDDINLLWDVFACDTRTSRTVRLSADKEEEWMEESRGPSIDDAGRIVAFASKHPIDADDIANDEDLYVAGSELARLLTARQPK